MKIPPSIKKASRIWEEPPQFGIPEAILKIARGNIFLAKVLVRRGFTDAPSASRFLNPTLCSNRENNAMPDLERAVKRLMQAIAKREWIAIWGDFDVDGQTATAVTLSALRAMGGKAISYIPVRAQESHGLNLMGIDRLLDQGVNLILTVDTGITANEIVRAINKRRAEVIITDHHVLPKELPPAYAVVNPQRLPKGHALSYLSGVGCAFKVIQALAYAMEKEEISEELLDLVALGTIADSVPLLGENRALVRYGMQKIRSQCRPSIEAILRRAQVLPENVNEEHINFILAPRMNAMGRLADANPMVDFLLSEDQSVIDPMVETLENLNKERKILSDMVVETALQQIERDKGIAQSPVIVLSNPLWRQGVLGIAASRIAEMFNKPTILLSEPGEGIARGSARSVEGFHITDALSQMDEVLNSFGGHPMAAGLSLQMENVPLLRKTLANIAEQERIDPRNQKILPIETYLAPEHIDERVTQALEQMAPFGAGNPPMIFATRNIHYVRHSSFGTQAEHLLITMSGENGEEHSFIWWNGDVSRLPLSGEAIDLAFFIHANNFRGEERIVLEWVATRPAEIKATQSFSDIAGVHIFDLRKIENPIKDLAKVINEEDPIIWNEGIAIPEISSRTRRELVPTQGLVIWSVPPSKDVLEHVLSVVKPRKVFLYACEDPSIRSTPFLQKLAGLIRFILRNTDGCASLNTLGGLTAECETTVEKGIQWFIANGNIFARKEKGAYCFREGGIKNPDELKE